MFKPNALDGAVNLFIVSPRIDDYDGELILDDGWRRPGAVPPAGKRDDTFVSTEIRTLAP